jgi:predicted transcriptional regulator
MSTKIAKAKEAKSGLRYAPEDLVPRNVVADETALDAYLKRNKDALNASIERAHAEFERGEYFTLDQVMADVRVQRKRRAPRKP